MEAIQKIKDNEQKIIDEETRKRTEVERMRLKEWELKFDAERKRKDEEQFLEEERLRDKEEQRKKKLELAIKNPDQMN